MRSLAVRVAIAAVAALGAATAMVYAATREVEGDSSARGGSSWGALEPSPLQRTTAACTC